MQRTILQLESSQEILRQKAIKLTSDEIKSEKIQKLIQEMKLIMREAPGVGLAAPQIGLSIQLAVIEDSAERLKDLSHEVLKDRKREEISFHVIINPQIIELSGKTNYFFEACLSVRGRTRVTPRYDSIKIDCLDENGEKKTILADGWYARILQHEIGHLNGELYIDIADSRTELVLDNEYTKTWSNANSAEILKFKLEKCPNCKVE